MSPFETLRLRKPQAASASPLFAEVNEAADGCAHHDPTYC
jgi:hypothetical protein